MLAARAEAAARTLLVVEVSAAPRLCRGPPHTSYTTSKVLSAASAAANIAAAEAFAAADFSDGNLGPAGPDFEAAGPDLTAAGPDLTAAGPGPDLTAAGPAAAAAAAGPGPRALGPSRAPLGSPGILRGVASISQGIGPNGGVATPFGHETVFSGCFRPAYSAV